MPYSSRKTGKNEITVYKKDSGKVVGHTTPEKFNDYMAALHMHEPKGMAEGGCVGYAEGGEVPNEEFALTGKEEKDPSIIPEDIKEFVRQAHKDRQESRPDENWRIAPHERPEPIASYKKDEESETAAAAAPIPSMAEGGDVPDPNAVLQDIAPAGTGILTPPMTNQPAPPPAANVAPAPAPIAAAPAPVAPAAPAVAVPASTDQDFMNRATNMLGLDPAKQAAFMRLLGSKGQLGQIGAGIAGIGDAIASGGTLGKVNPGNLEKSENLIEGKQKAGIEGMKTIQETQEKAFDVAQKLQAQDPNSPLSKYAQKAYGSLGKKIGLDLSHASAGLISDVTGKGVEALTSEYEAELKKMGLGLQKEQIEATIGQRKAELENAKAGRTQEAAKAIAAQGLLAKGANLITPSGRAAQATLARQAAGTTYTPDVMAYAQKHGITPEQAQAVKDKRTGGG